MMPAFSRSIGIFQRHWPTDESIYVDCVREGVVGNGAARLAVAAAQSVILISQSEYKSAWTYGRAELSGGAVKHPQALVASFLDHPVIRSVRHW
jgi:hypothetical protein